MKCLWNRDKDFKAQTVLNEIPCPIFKHFRVVHGCQQSPSGRNYEPPSLNIIIVFQKQFLWHSEKNQGRVSGLMRRCWGKRLLVTIESLLVLFERNQRCKAELNSTAVVTSSGVNWHLSSVPLCLYGHYLSPLFWTFVSILASWQMRITSPFSGMSYYIDAENTLLLIFHYLVQSLWARSAMRTELLISDFPFSYKMIPRMLWTIFVVLDQ